MLITTATNSPREVSYRASTPAETSAGPADSASIGSGQRNAKADAALKAISTAATPQEVSQANRAGYKALDEIASSSSNPVEKAVARAAHAASGARAYPSTTHAFQKEALTLLGNGMSGEVTPALAQLGDAALSAGKEPVEGRNMGRRVLETLAETSQSPAEKGFANAVLRAIPAPNSGDPSLPTITDESACSGLKVAFQTLSAGVDSAEKAIAGFGTKLGEIASTEGNAGQMGLALLESLTQISQNPNAQAGVELSRSYEYANAPTLLASQKKFFQNIEAGTGLTQVSEAASEWRSKMTDTAASVGGALAVQGLLYALPPGWMRWVGGLVGGTLIYSGVKGVYNGMVERNRRAASGRRHDADFVNQGFGVGFKSAFTAGGLMSSVTHAGFINSTAASLCGHPLAFGIGPGISGIYTYITSGAPK